MKPKKAIKELEKQLRKDPENLVLRLKLAAVYREVGRRDDAVALYRSVAVAYHSQGRLVQAIAVCKSVLEIEPSQRETQTLLTELDRMRALQAVETAKTAEAGEQALQAVARDQARAAGGEGQAAPAVADEIPNVAAVHRERQHEGYPAAPDRYRPAPPGYGTPQGYPSPRGYAPPEDDDDLDAPPQAMPSTPSPRAINPLGVQSPRDAVTTPLPSVGAPPEFGARSGMTPLNKDPTVPPIEEVTPGSQMRRLRERAHARNPRTTQQGPAVAAPGPGRRRSSQSMSHTPLPEPLALHEADPSVVESMPLPDSSRRPFRQFRETLRPDALGPPASRRTPPLPLSPAPASDEDDDAMTRIADERISEDEILAEVAASSPHGLPRASSEDDPTTIAADSLGDDDGPTIIAPPNMAAMMQDGVLPEFDEPDDPDEDALTTIADDRSGALPLRPRREERQGGPSGLAGRQPDSQSRSVHVDLGAEPPVPSAFSRETRRLEEDEVQELVARGRDDDFDDLPTPPPLGPFAGAETPPSAPPSVPAKPSAPRTAPTPDRRPAARSGKAVVPPGPNPGAKAIARIKPQPARRRVPLAAPPATGEIVKPNGGAGARAPGGPRPTKETSAPVEEPRPTKRYPRLTGDQQASAAPRSEEGRPTVKNLGESAAGPGTGKRELPGQLSQFKRGDRLIDVDNDAFSDEAVTLDRSLDEVKAALETADEANVITNVARRPVRPARAAQQDEEDELELNRAFDKPFADTINKLGPDGAVIDMPLSIFSVLPDDALAEMARRMKLRRFDPSELVLREGDPGDACYVIAHGEVRVLKRDPLNPRGDLIEVARLGAGSLFGEFALLADRRRHATVQAVDSCDIYEIPRRLLRELAATFPEVGPLLEKFYRERLLATLLSTAPFFKPLPEERRGELLARFRPRRAESGERIVVEGKTAGGLYLIVLGSVEITKRVSDKRSVLLATLGEGAYFGEMSLLKGGVACASVRAVGPTELAVMSPKDFYEVVSDNPRLWDEVRREANRRQLEMSQIVTGETNVT